MLTAEIVLFVMEMIKIATTIVCLPLNQKNLVNQWANVRQMKQANFNHKALAIHAIANVLINDTGNSAALPVLCLTLGPTHVIGSLKHQDAKHYYFSRRSFE